MSTFNNNLPVNEGDLRADLAIIADWIKAESKVLDLGCGDGRLTSFIGEFTKTEGIELSEEAVSIANKKYPHVHFFRCFREYLTHPTRNM